MCGAAASSFNADARFTGAYSAYRALLRRQMPVILFTSIYTALTYSLVLVGLAVYVLFLGGYQSKGDSFAQALTAIAYLAGYTLAVGNLAMQFGDVLPTIGIFQRISNGLQKVRDVLNTYQEFDERYGVRSRIDVCRCVHMYITRESESESRGLYSGLVEYRNEVGVRFLTCRTPRGEVLFRDMTFSVQPGER